MARSASAWLLALAGGRLRLGFLKIPKPGDALVPLAADHDGVALGLHPCDGASGRDLDPDTTPMAFAGLVIALLGALVPARGAARLTIAEVLQDE